MILFCFLNREAGCFLFWCCSGFCPFEMRDPYFDHFIYWRFCFCCFLKGKKKNPDNSLPQDNQCLLTRRKIMLQIWNKKTAGSRWQRPVTLKWKMKGGKVGEAMHWQRFSINTSIYKSFQTLQTLPLSKPTQTTAAISAKEGFKAGDASVHLKSIN